ncbi:MAG: hypothetical protein ACFFDW_08880 [Candidatus Thorarchaeota archaeon]
MQKNFKSIFQLIGGITGIAALIFSLIQLLLSYIITSKYSYQTPIAEDVLTVFYNNSILGHFTYIFVILIGITVIPASIGVFIFLREKIPNNKNLLFIPLVFHLIGAITIIISYMWELIVIKNLAAEFISAVEPEKSEIIAQYSEISFIFNVLSVVSYIFLFGLGTGIFGYFSLKVNLNKTTMNWLAFVGAFLALFRFGIFLKSSFGQILVLGAQIGSILFLFWLGNICYFIIRDILKPVEKTIEIEAN